MTFDLIVTKDMKYKSEANTLQVVGGQIGVYKIVKGKMVWLKAPILYVKYNKE